MRDRNIENKILWILVIVLFTCLAVLIIGMYNGTITYKYNSTLIEALATFGGALAGASIAGYFSVVIFNKNLSHEEQKRQNEQIIKKAIYINDYLKLSRALMNELRLFNFKFVDIMSKDNSSTQDLRKSEFQFNKFTPVLLLCKRKNSAILDNLVDLQSKLERLSYNDIKDYEFARMISDHIFSLEKIKENMRNMMFVDTINEYKDLWEIQETIASIQKYLSDFEHLEELLRNLKGNSSHQSL